MNNFDYCATLNHIPMRPVRDGITGEMIFSQAWHKLMSTPVLTGLAPMLLQVLEMFRHIANQQDAHVLASLVTWFGTRTGKLFLDSVNGSEDPDRYLKAWGSQNKSVPWVNEGRRTLELVLYGENHDEFMTMRQAEVAECLMSWLGRAPEAQDFLKDCEETIVRKDKEDGLVFYLTANCHLAEDQVAQVLRLVKNWAG